MDARANTDIRNPSSPAPDVMIFGSGACAQKIAANLSACDINVWLAARGDTPRVAGHDNHVHWLTDIESAACTGFAKNFNLKLKQKGSLLHLNVPAIIVAEDDHHSANYAPYGLKPHSRVLTISSLEEKIHPASTPNPFESGARVVFLCGWRKDSHATVARRMVEGCLRLQHRSGIATYFMTGNLKVAANGAEALVQKAKRAGTVFLKFTRDYPTITTLADDRFEIDYLDEPIRTPFRLKADWMVVDESIGPGQCLKTLSQGLGIDQDGIGFAQSDNVHRMSNFTNRRGVFVAGGSRGILSEEAHLADADQVSLNVLTFLHDLEPTPLPEVAIVRGRCARCLTCHRLCPHQAIDIDGHISIVSEACQSCGICLASCPARAIEMEGMHIGTDIYQRIREPAGDAETPDGIPHVLVFGCTRSAGQARALTRLTGRSLPKGVTFIEVPCGGTISSRHLLAAFEAGADGVILCTCHTGNCKSEIGNQLARKRTDSARNLLSEAGVESERLNIASVAANMDTEFSLMIDAFVDRINALNAG